MRVQSGSARTTAASVSVMSSPANARVPGEHLEQHRAERPDVGALVDGPAARLLGRHVGGRAENHPRLRHGRRRDGRRLAMTLGDAPDAPAGPSLWRARSRAPSRCRRRGP